MEQMSYTNFDERLSLVNDSNSNIFELDFDNLGPDFNSVFSTVRVEPFSSDDESSFTDTKPDINEIRSHREAYPPPIRAMAGVGENPRYVRSQHEMPLSHIRGSSGRWGNVMVSKYTRDIINEVERQAKVSVRSTHGSSASSCV